MSDGGLANEPSGRCGAVHSGFTGSPGRRRRYLRPGALVESTGRILPPIPVKTERNTTTRIQYFTGNSVTEHGAEVMNATRAADPA
jgi:hypothetical protein